MVPGDQSRGFAQFRTFPLRVQPVQQPTTHFARDTVQYFSRQQQQPCRPFQVSQSAAKRAILESSCDTGHHSQLSRSSPSPLVILLLQSSTPEPQGSPGDLPRVSFGENPHCLLHSISYSLALPALNPGSPLPSSCNGLQLARLGLLYLKQPHGRLCHLKRGANPLYIHWA